MSSTLRFGLLVCLATAPLAACTGKDDDTASDDTGGGDTDTAGDSGDTDTAVDSNDTETGDTGDTLPNGIGALPAATCEEQGGACVLEGTYTTSMRLTADRPWLLRGGVAIGDDSAETVLGIEPGTQIYGESASNAFLVIRRGSKLLAEGYADAPIVFQPDTLPGSRTRGDWGGLAINGRAPINTCADGSADCEAEGEGGIGSYGGDDPQDNSGVLKYVRVEFAGREISPDNELNGITWAGVGAGTTCDFVQSHMGSDDGMEFFGGTVSCRHLVLSGQSDDGFDLDNGYRGKVQYLVIQQAEDEGNNGVESDDHASAYTATPTTSPTVSNVTIVGSEDITAQSNFGLLLRRGTGGHYHNVAVTGFNAACLAMRDQDTYDRYADGTGELTHVRLACDTAWETGTEQAVFDAGADNALVGDLGLKDASFDHPDLRPDSGSPLLGAGEAPSDSWFEAADYIGAFGDEDWTAGWTTRARD